MVNQLASSTYVRTSINKARALACWYSKLYINVIKVCADEVLWDVSICTVVDVARTT
jgi:hypothetical protein